MSRHVDLGTTWRVVIVVALCGFLPAADAFFQEDFSNAVQNPNFEPYSPYFTVSGGAMRRTTAGGGDLRYLRTQVADYNLRNFVFEITFSTKEDAVFIGLGEANRDTAYHIAGNSLYLRIYQPSVADGSVVIGTANGEMGIGRLYSGGPHRARFTKVGKRLTISVDEKFDGTFEDDVYATFVDLDGAASFLTNTNSHLFFGKSAQEDFDDISVIAPPVPETDCNSNGIEDAVDIEVGPSVDADTDGIPDECEVVRAYFVDNFERQVMNPSLEGYGPFFGVENGGIHRLGTFEFDNGFYMRTSETDYNERDFDFEITFTTKEDIVDIGIGEGVGGPPYGEPTGSVYFRAHPLGLGGAVSFRHALGEDGVGTFKTSGPHRARISKKGAAVTLSIQDHYTGEFKADFSKSYPDLAVIAPFLNNRNSRLLFGNRSPAETFDDLLVSNPNVQGPDCNQNGVEDSADLANRNSKDQNSDAVPDECQTVPGHMELEQADSGCVLVVLECDVAIRGGELGLSYDPQWVTPVTVTPAADLPPDATIRLDLSPVNGCPLESGVAAGFTVSWSNSAEGDVLTPAGRHALLKVCFDHAHGAYQGGSFALDFVKCLGGPDFPTRNVVTDSSGDSLFVIPLDGEVTLPETPAFRRGDANEDTKLDISDPVAILWCLFLGGYCSVCPAAMDTNDDERTDISDGVYLLYWLFLDGRPPPPPFPDCGRDETTGPLPPCERQPSCP